MKRPEGSMPTIVLAVLLSLLAPAVGAAEDWPMFQKDSAHSGCYSSSLGKLEVKWAFKADDRIMASPVVQNGVVYVGTLGGTFYAVDAADGRPKWQMQSGSRISFAAVCLGDSVAFGTEQGSFVCLDAADGQVKWRVQAAGALWSNPCLSDGRVFFCDNAGGLYAVDLGGKLLWKKQLTQNRYALTACHPAARDGVVYALANTEQDGARGVVYALTASSGKEIWHANLESPFTAVFMPVPDTGPTVGEGLVYVQTTDGIHALAAETGFVRWKLSGQGTQGTCATDGKRVYAKQGRAAWALDAATGAPVGSCPLEWGLEGMGFASLVACGGAMVDTGHGPRISMDEISARKQMPLTTWLNVIGDRNMYGEKYRWRHYFLQSTPALADGCLFVGAGDGRLYCFRQTGR